MLQVMGLALLLVVGVVVPAAADEAREAAVAGATWHGGVAAAQAPIPARVAATPRRADSAVALAPERRERETRIQLPWLAQAGSGLAISVSERFSLGVGYRRVVGEDLWREFAEAGSVDYESHNILLRAHWRF
jgi:hypothetical protein